MWTVSHVEVAGPVRPLARCSVGFVCVAAVACSKRFLRRIIGCLGRCYVKDDRSTNRDLVATKRSIVSTAGLEKSQMPRSTSGGTYGGQPSIHMQYILHTLHSVHTDKAYAAYLFYARHRFSDSDARKTCMGGNELIFNNTSTDYIAMARILRP
jgi:hypothetical protein